MIGIALYSPKNIHNWGSILRLATNFNVDFCCTIQSRYKRQWADTTNFAKNNPVFHFEDISQFLVSYPKQCKLISVEINSRALSLEKFIHPENAIYIFGPEEGSINNYLIDNSDICLKITSNRCLNQAMCAGAVLFHRHLQEFNRERVLP